MRRVWIGCAVAVAVVALVTACGLDVRGEGTAVSTTEPKVDGGAPVDGAADAAPSVDASSDGNVPCPVRCGGVCMETCSSCASGTSACDGVCVPSCNDDCPSKRVRCVGCTATGDARPLCASDRNACPAGVDACACTSVTTCPSGEHVCIGGRCLTCSATTGDGLTCQGGKTCKTSEAKCD